MTMDKHFDFWDTVNKPKWLTDASYVTLMGSHAYGSATEESDYDFYGFCVPPMNVIFPFLSGDIPQFGKQKKNFNQLQLQGIPSEKYGDTDITIYNIARYFHLVMENNPNMLDSLFVPEDCIVFSDNVGKMVRERRRIFLSEKLFHRFKGMAYSHMKRITSRTREGKRKEHVEKYGFDVKDASHVVRLMCEVEDFLLKGDADISANACVIRAVRDGEWSLEHVTDFFEGKITFLESELELGKSVLPKYPDENRIKILLVECLEEKYGSLSEYGWNILGGEI